MTTRRLAEITLSDIVPAVRVHLAHAISEVHRLALTVLYTERRALDFVFYLDISYHVICEKIANQRLSVAVSCHGEEARF